MSKTRPQLATNLESETSPDLLNARHVLIDTPEGPQTAEVLNPLIPPNSELHQIEHPKKLRKLLDEMRTTRSALGLALAETEVLATGTLIDFSMDTREMKIKFFQGVPHPETLIKKNTIGYFKSGLLKAKLYFDAPFLRAEDDGLIFLTPDEIFEQQRRYAFRLPLPQSAELAITFQIPGKDSKFHRGKIYNISSGGLAFLVSPPEKVEFDPGLKLQSMTFDVLGQSVQCNGTVCHCSIVRKEVGPELIVVGVCFEGLSPFHKEIIDFFVFKEGINYLNRYFDE